MTELVIDLIFFFFQAEDGIRDLTVTGVQTCALPISGPDVISGGDFGLEGGLACTAVFLTAIGIIAMRTRRTEDSAKMSADFGAKRGIAIIWRYSLDEKSACQTTVGLEIRLSAPGFHASNVNSRVGPS